MAKQNTLEAVNNRIVDDDEEFADGYLMHKEGRYKLWEYLDQSVTHKKQAILQSMRPSPVYWSAGMVC